MKLYLDGRIGITRADLTTLDVDAVVNAANSTLLGGGGVDGAIHCAAGPELLEACRALGGARTGETKITRGYRLKARFVIHAVGPVWRGGSQREPELLARCYGGSLDLALEHQFQTVAFPSISTGAYGYPIAAAARIAQATVRAFLERSRLPAQVVFWCFSEADRRVYEEIAGELLRSV